MKHQREMKEGERKIEDMTAKEIKHLKNNIINQMHVALCTQLRAYDEFCTMLIFTRKKIKKLLRLTMGDKDMNELFGNLEFMIGDKPLGAITDCMLEMPECDTRETELKAFQDSLGFQISAPANQFFFGADFASEPSKQVCSLIIEGKPIVNKPRNLKSPNKKRARRVWKKWAKRYGTSPGKMIYLPDVEVESEMANEQYGYPCWRVKAKPIKS